MLGDLVIDDGIEFIIVWAGGEGLAADRETRSLNWVAPKRLYNKTGKFAKSKPEPTLENIFDED